MKRILAIGMLVLCLCACAVQQPANTTLPQQWDVARVGVQIEKDAVWRATQTVLTLPGTFEIWLQTSGGSSAEMVLLSTAGNGMDAIEIVMDSKGRPTLRWITPDGTEFAWQFDDVDLRRDSWVHLAIVRDAEKRCMACYVDGQLCQEIPASVTPDTLPVRPYCIGGDHSPENQRAFKGQISSVAIYDHGRTAQQIRADMAEPGQEGLLCHYELGQGSADLSGNGLELVRSVRWFAEKEPLVEYAYSMVVVGDTQIVARNASFRMEEIFSYIADNVQAKNIQFVIGVGDVTNDDTQSEWDAAVEAYALLDGVVPYAVARGTEAHDSVDGFAAAFPKAKYANGISGAMGEDMRNVYYDFDVGDVKYTLLILDAVPSDEEIAWAAQVIEAKPDRNVILTTHIFLYRDGTTLGEEDLYPSGSNHGQALWEKLVRKYENITLVLCGHDPCSQVVMTQLEGDHGNLVSCLLVDGQSVDSAEGASGLVATLYFSEDGRQVQVEYYSPLKQQYFLTENQFSFTLDIVE